MSLLALLALGACAAPPALTIAAAALTGASYVTTGKGPTDHALSLATSSDCNLLRAVATGPRTPLCVRRETIMVASADGSGAAPPEPAPQPAPGVPTDAGMIAAIVPAAGFAAMAGGTLGADGTPGAGLAPGLPAEAAAAIGDAIAWRDAALRLAGDQPAARDAIARVAEAEVTAAVIASIASHPQAVAAIVAAAVGAAPEHRATITARASAAFPGFAGAIAWAASAPPVPPVRLADATQRPAA